MGQSCFSCYKSSFFVLNLKSTLFRCIHQLLLFSCYYSLVINLVIVCHINYRHKIHFKIILIKICIYIQFPKWLSKGFYTLVRNIFKFIICCFDTWKYLKSFIITINCSQVWMNNVCKSNNWRLIQSSVLF